MSIKTQKSNYFLLASLFFTSYLGAMDQSSSVQQIKAQLSDPVLKDGGSLSSLSSVKNKVSNQCELNKIFIFTRSLEGSWNKRWKFFVTFVLEHVESNENYIILNNFGFLKAHELDELFNFGSVDFKIQVISLNTYNGQHSLNMYILDITKKFVNLNKPLVDLSIDFVKFLTWFELSAIGDSLLLITSLRLIFDYMNELNSASEENCCKFLIYDLTSSKKNIGELTRIVEKNNGLMRAVQANGDGTRHFDSKNTLMISEFDFSKIGQMYYNTQQNCIDIGKKGIGFDLKNCIVGISLIHC